MAIKKTQASKSSRLTSHHKSMWIEIGELLKARREDGLHISRQQMANRIGVRYETVSRWERGEHIPEDLSRFRSIAESYEFNYQEVDEMCRFILNLTLPTENCFLLHHLNLRILSENKIKNISMSITCDQTMVLGRGDTKELSKEFYYLQCDDKITFSKPLLAALFKKECAMLVLPVKFLELGNGDILETLDILLNIREQDLIIDGLLVPSPRSFYFSPGIDILFSSLGTFGILIVHIKPAPMPENEIGADYMLNRHFQNVLEMVKNFKTKHS